MDELTKQQRKQCVRERLEAFMNSDTLRIPQSDEEQKKEFLSELRRKIEKASRSAGYYNLWRKYYEECIRMHPEWKQDYQKLLQEFSEDGGSDHA